MCGIAGIFSKNEIAPGTLELMTDALAHRGPDANGYFYEKRVALGHRRLSVIDLDARSNQPFFSNHSKYVIVFNGEIYNYKKIASRLLEAGVSLRTTSDTEVVIEAFALWGPGFVHELEGMFAFVIYDTLQEKLFLFRDRVGKKPLFYFLSDGIFAFASEIKSLRQHPEIKRRATLKKSVIGAFMQQGFIEQPNTFFEHIFKFSAGHYGIISSQLSLSILPYWSVTHHLRTQSAISQGSAIDQLKQLIDDAVMSRLVADVPLGILLSGGIDSSVVAAVAARDTHIKTFSIGFREAKFDESKYAERIAKYLRTDHHQYILSSVEAMEMLETGLTHFDEPFADTSAIPMMLVSKKARESVTVALTGDGGDELFLGYGAHIWARRLANPMWQNLKPLAHALMSRIPASRWKRAAHMFEDAHNRERHIFSQEQYFFSEREVEHNLFNGPDCKQSYFDDDLYALPWITPAERQALFDFQVYLRDDLLVKVDRASMLYSLECRCPLLDHRLVEYVINLPASFKLRGNTSKYLLKKILFELIPPKYFDRPKWGFSIPLDQWLKKDLGYLMRFIAKPQIEQTGIFNFSYVNSLVERFNQGENYLYNRLWLIIVIQRFLNGHS